METTDTNYCKIKIKQIYCFLKFKLFKKEKIMCKKIFRITFLLLLLSASILHGRISKKALLRKICCLQRATNCICSELEIIKNSSTSTPTSSPTSTCATLITQTDIDSAGGTLLITESGLYKLCEDVNGCIEINTSNVTLDLDSHTISGQANGVFVNSAQDVVIKNGSIKEAGIGIFSNENSARIENVKISDCSIAIYLSSDQNIVENCIVTSCENGIFIFGDDNTISNCKITNITSSDSPYAIRIGRVDNSADFKQNSIFNNSIDTVSGVDNPPDLPSGIFALAESTRIVGNSVTKVTSTEGNGVGIRTFGKIFNNTSFGNNKNYDLNLTNNGDNGNYVKN